MSISERYFSIGRQWNVIHLPSKPNGFAVFIIGDVNHYVEEQACSWLEEPKRLHFIESLRTKGYTIFSSNLYGRKAGSEEPIKLAEQVYHFVMKKEILNKKIHIVAEGMGALLSIKIAQKLPDSIRSVVMINPNPHLYRHFKKEKDINWIVPDAPTQIFQETHSRLNKEEQKKKLLTVFQQSTIVPQLYFCKKGRSLSCFNHSIYPFLQEYEKEL